MFGFLPNFGRVSASRIGSFLAVLIAFQAIAPVPLAAEIAKFGHLQDDAATILEFEVATEHVSLFA